MTVKFNSPGVSAEDAGFVVPSTSLTSVPAVVIGTSPKGPAFVPSTFSKIIDFQEKFGIPYVSGSRVSSYERTTNYAPFAAIEWMRNVGSTTFIRVLGIGDGKKRISVGANAGDVTNSGFTVGEKQPDHDNFSGLLSENPYANPGGVLGRTYFLGCFMSDSVGSSFFNSAGLQGTGSVNGVGINTSVPIVRGILMAPSGVILTLSASASGLDSNAPSSTLVAIDSNIKGTTLGAVKMFDQDSGAQLQQFILLLNGHKGSEEYPNVITASLDMQSSQYITRVFNTTASLIQQAGHYLAANWDIHPSVAVLTGTGVTIKGAGSPSDSSRLFSTERSIFLLTSSLARDTGSSSVPNYEGFRDRFSHASSPWIISQKIHGKYINLFKLHSLNDGEQSEKYKIIIHDITPIRDDGGYKFGNFSLTIRKIDDFEEIFPPLETFINLNLNPSSDRYIAKIIGDFHTYFDFDRPENSQKIVVEGNYANNSKYIRVEMSNEVSNSEILHEILPLGFRGIPHIITSGSSVMSALAGQDSSAMLSPTFIKNLVVPPIPYSNNILTNIHNQDASTTRRWGIRFDHIVNVEKQNDFQHKDSSILSFLKHFPNHSTTNVNFSVSDNYGTPDSTALGIIDCDRFCNNLFTLENIKIVTSSTGYSSKDDWKNALYVRNGVIHSNDVEKSRRVSIKDFEDLTSRRFLSFQTSLFGGFDGVNVFEKNELNLTNEAVVADLYDSNRGKLKGSSTSAYLHALEMTRNASEVDMQILSIPGIRVVEVIDRAIDVAESRLDTLCIIDLEQIDDNDKQLHISKILPYDDSFIPNFEKTINAFDVRGLNTSYAAAYYPDVVLKIDAPTYGVDSVIVPPSVPVLGAISFNDAVSSPWNSPAGNIRGGLENVFSTTVKFDKNEIDSLYSKNINFLYAPSNVRGAGTGVIIGGQKTLNKSMSSLSRINVRRLLLEIRRRIRGVALRFIFENQRDTTINRFVSDASESISEIQNSFGLESYRIQIDASQTTQTDIDNQTIKGKIYIKPLKSIDYLSLDFIVSNNLQSEI